MMVHSRIFITDIERERRFTRTGWHRHLLKMRRGVDDVPARVCDVRRVQQGTHELAGVLHGGALERGMPTPRVHALPLDNLLHEAMHKLALLEVVHGARVEGGKHDPEHEVVHRVVALEVKGMILTSKECY